MRRVRLAAAAAAAVLALTGVMMMPSPALCPCSGMVSSEPAYAAQANTIFIGVVTATDAQSEPSPQAGIDAFPVAWLALGGGLAVAALILYLLHTRRL